jgi:hypothetical protein
MLRGAGWMRAGDCADGAVVANALYDAVSVHACSSFRSPANG